MITQIKWASFLLLLLSTSALNQGSVNNPKREIISRSSVITSVAQACLFFPISALADVSSRTDGLWPDVDGEIGWVWGGKDRCAPEDENCRNNGQIIREGDLKAPLLPVKPEGIPVVSRYAFDVDIGGKYAGQLQMALWGKVAPSTVEAFSGMCEGSQLLSAVDSSGSSTGAALFGPWSWNGASVERVDSNQHIIFSKVKLPLNVGRREAKELNFALPLPPVPSANRTPYNGGGYIRVRRQNPGQIEFAVSCGLGTENMREWMTIGHIEGGNQTSLLLARLNGIAVNKYSSAPLRKVLISNVTKL